MDEQILKPIVEVTYLNTGNAWRYRAILRYFYLQHESLRHFLFPEEIFAYLKQNIHFQEYTEEQLQQDLSQLVDWKNLIPRQDTGKVSSIEEFKKKRFRYQCSPYTIEIERMVQGLEQLGNSFGGSLERTLFDRLIESLLKVHAWGKEVELEGRSGLSDEELYNLWQELYEHFRKLTENATDYLAHLQSEKVEEMMMTEAFLAYKDAITQYLRNFMTALQRSSIKIEALIQEIKPEIISLMADKLANYYLTIPRLDDVPTKEALVGKYLLQWRNLSTWFLGYMGRDSDLVYLQNITNETIRRITRFAQRLGERHHNFKSRKNDYLHLANWFNGIEDLQEAHQLAACVFGVFHTRHIFAEERETEDIYQEVWDHSPTQITINPRVRNYREKTKPNAITSNKEAKERMLEEYLLEKQAEQKLIDEMIKHDQIVMGQLPIVDPYIRKTLLNWISKCMSNSDWKGKTENGRFFKLVKLDNSTIALKAQDGIMQMPNFAFQFIKENGDCNG